LQAAAPFIERLPSERTFSARVRFRTIGDMTCTGAIRSSAETVDAILDEIRAATITERGATRADDRFSEAAMEDRKREGYF
jgi:sulfate adenylyltransferase subunit 2